MSKLNELPNITSLEQSTFVTELVRVLRANAQKVNQMAAGVNAGFDNQGTAAPTTGTWAQGDFIKHSAPVEAGAAASKYVIWGFGCVAGGTPGTWVQLRFLTGN
jgi:hypothetical protein